MPTRHLLAGQGRGAAAGPPGQAARPSQGRVRSLLGGRETVIKTFPGYK